jgi:hypothetical protein
VGDFHPLLYAGLSRRFHYVPKGFPQVYDLIISLKRRPEEEKRKKGLPAYQRVRRALKQCKSSLSEDILVEREDRI